MSKNTIAPKPIIELKDMKFFIPRYQRGYRWTAQQVKDLLDDILENKNKRDENFYCIQPLAVKKREHDIWEVIDGQQRLTTIFIILSCLGEKDFYKIEYETRHGSKNSENNSSTNNPIDSFYINNAKETVVNWLKNKKFNDKDKEEFKAYLLNYVEFIWYESYEEDPIAVFTRLNIGKIGLTNAELIKALFLQSSNFANPSKIFLEQQKIALEWDNIEYTLQSDEFWLFLNKIEYDKPTRIDMIFDLICEKDIFKLFEDNKDNKDKEIGCDEYRTFRYFYKFFRDNKGNYDDIKKCWEKIKEVFQTFCEWFDNIELYHYAGYLIACNESINELYEQWGNLKSKEEFNRYMKDSIKDKIKKCKDLEQTYEYKEKDLKKTNCKNLLLLHNIQTVINQVKNSMEQYKEHIFYKFPFHIYKKEKWDVEHIDSNTENDLDEYKDQKEWLKYALLYQEVEKDESLYSAIKKYIEGNKEDKDSFKDIKEKIIKKLPNNNKLSDEEKNKIWNFVLLDMHTNRGYGNAIFPAKRRCIIKKDQGKIAVWDEENFKWIIKDSPSSFVPVCTKYAFLKYYNAESSSINYWDKKDAAAYKENIKNTLKEFLE